MKKKIVNISLIIVGILVVSMIGTKAATAIQSSMVTYNNTTVKETLDDLVDITVQGDATSDDIALGKTAVVKGELITGSMTNTQGAPKIAMVRVAYMMNASETSTNGASATFTIPEEYGNITSEQINVIGYGTFGNHGSTYSATTRNGYNLTPFEVVSWSYDESTRVLSYVYRCLPHTGWLGGNVIAYIAYY